LWKLELKRQYFDLSKLAPFLTVDLTSIAEPLDDTEIVRRMLKLSGVDLLLSMSERELPELTELRKRLETFSPAEARLLVKKWRTLSCCNASFVKYMEVLTATLGCNTAPYFLGGGEAAKAAMFYICST
jgi:hypothetical protein